ncbi:MAG TPA: hypothetical protein VE129_14495, partial [Thermoanaerobaculia bacterium]|nr:hypothetical protein [Thermoanaerobaculia bacterium]
DVAVFRLDQAVQVGSVKLPAGVYEFRASDRGVVSVHDEENATVVGVVLACRASLKVAELETSGTLSHDWAVRTLSLGAWRYSFPAGQAPATMAAVSQATTVVALAR